MSILWYYAFVMVDHEYPHSTNQDLETGLQSMNSSVAARIDYTQLADRIRAAYQHSRLVVEVVGNELADDVPMITSGFISETIDQRHLAAVPDLHKRLGEYSFTERVGVLHAHPQAKFVPSVRSEVSDALLRRTWSIN
jgi:hypothetical protein